MEQNTAAPDPQTAPVEGGATADEATAELDALRAQVEAANDKYLRLAAEYDNFRKRTIKERQDERGRAQADLVKLLMDPLDDLTRFAGVDVASASVPMMVEGAALVARKVFKELNAGGLTVLEAHVRGCPTISYGWGRGHIRVHNEAFRRFGFAEVAATRGELSTALRSALVQRNLPGFALDALPSAASLVLALIA